MSSSQTMKIFFITGKPACGKDTQAEFLVKRFRVKKLITSRLLDRFFARTTRRRITIDGVSFNIEKQKQNRLSGKLVAYRLVVSIVRQALEQASNRKQAIVVAGSPRSVVEARSYLEFCRERYGERGCYFIHINISDREAIRRALVRYRTAQRRNDNLDQLKIIKERLKVFRDEVLPGIQYLKRQGALIEVNGEQTPTQVFRQIVKAVK